MFKQLKESECALIFPNDVLWCGNRNRKKGKKQHVRVILRNGRHGRHFIVESLETGETWRASFSRLYWQPKPTHSRSE